MSLPHKKPADINARLTLVKSGFKAYISTIKLPLSADTKWTLEIVCINENPNLPANFMALNISPNQKAQYYIYDYAWKVATNINQNKQQWINVMKNS